MTLRVVVSAAEDLLELDTVKGHLRVDHDDDDVTIAALLGAAQRLLEAATQRIFLTSTVEWVLPAWPCRSFRLPVAPVAAVEAITYIDAAGETQTLPADQYVATPHGPTLSLRPLSGAVWPLLSADAAEPVVIRFLAGQAAEDLPPNVTRAALLLTSHLFDDRGGGTLSPAASNLPPAVEALIGSERWD